jgi:hypothetical protein
MKSPVENRPLKMPAPAAPRRTIAALRASDLVRLLNSTPLGPVTTANTVMQWKLAGCPLNADGTYALHAVAAWLAVCRKEGRAGDSRAASDMRRRQAESRMDKEKAAADCARLRARREALEMKEAEGRLVARALHLAALASYARAFRASLSRLENLAPLLAGANVIEIKETLKTETARICDGLLAECRMQK